MAYIPLIALLTAGFELGGALWVLRGKEERKLRILVAVMLVVLAIYQLLEVVVCGGPSTSLAARVAHFDISFLPPLGLIIVVTLYQPRAKWPWIVAWGMMALALITAVGAVLSPSIGGVTSCDLVVAFYAYQWDGWLYAWGGLYDAGMLAMGGGAALAAIYTQDAQRRLLIGDMLLGTLGFMLTSMVVIVAMQGGGGAKGAAPSVLCHLAVILAFFLVRMVARLPGMAQAK